MNFLMFEGTSRVLKLKRIRQFRKLLQKFGATQAMEEGQKLMLANMFAEMQTERKICHSIFASSHICSEHRRPQFCNNSKSYL